MAAVTKERLAAGVQAIAAVAEAIKELGSVPSGHFYVRLMDHFTLEQYEKVIGILVRADLVSNKNHLLTWIGPK